MCVCVWGGGGGGGGGGGAKRKQNRKKTDFENTCGIVCGGEFVRDWPTQIGLKTIFCMNVCFMCDYYVTLISALVLWKRGNLRITVVV